MVDFGSHGRLGQRHMADRCNESKAVHISQSATGHTGTDGMAVGGGSWRPEAESHPQFAADRRAANLWPAASVRLVLAPPCQCASVPEERTSLDLLGLPAPLAFRPLRTLVRYLLLTAENIRPLHKRRGPRATSTAFETQTSAHSRGPEAHHDTALSHPQLVSAIYLADSCCCALRDVQILLMQIVINTCTARNCRPLRPRLVSCKHTGAARGPIPVRPIGNQHTHARACARAHRLPRMPLNLVGRSCLSTVQVNNVTDPEAVLCPLFCAHLPWGPRCRNDDTTVRRFLQGFETCQGQPWQSRTPSRRWSPISLWVPFPPKAYPNLRPYRFHNAEVLPPPAKYALHASEAGRLRQPVPLLAIGIPQHGA